MTGSSIGAQRNNTYAKESAHISTHICVNYYSCRNEFCNCPVLPTILSLLILLCALLLQIYNNWLTNIKDWCISRQLWWGHRIPVWYIVGKKCEEDYVVARNAEEALAKAQEKYGKSVEIYQDPDVLDTWFSRFVFLFKIVWYQLVFCNMDLLIA